VARLDSCANGQASIDSKAAELIDTHDNSHIWSQQLKRMLSDIAVLQKEIGR